MLKYRDKFIAHLDNEPIAHIPTFDIALKNAVYLYQAIRSSNPGWFHDLPANMGDYYQSCGTQAEAAWVAT